ncbi:MAG: glycosyltransferase family 4 protein [Gaiellaceae bacterium]
MKPRVLFVSRRVELPLSASLERKWNAVGRELDYRVLAGGDGDDGRFRLAPELPALDGAAFFAALPVRIARELREFRPHAVLAQGAHETAAALAARRLARVDTAVIADVHGDWRAPTRLYGSRLRTALNPVADRVALSGLRNADGIRTVTGYTTSLVREVGLEPADEFPAFMDFDSFLQEPTQPLPDTPRALFVGVLERYKNVDGLAAAWRLVQEQLPDARLHVVGRGREREVIERLVSDVPGVEWDETLPPERVVEALDRSAALLLPSNSEGLGRVVIEAFLRGRPVVGARVGGIPDLVRDGKNGLLVDPRDPGTIAAATVRVLSDRALAERLGAAARHTGETWGVTPAEYAEKLRTLVETCASRSSSS